MKDGKFEDRTQKELVAYMVFSSRKITNYTEKTIDNYIDKLKKDLKSIQLGEVLFYIDLIDFNYFEFNATLNIDEQINYAKLIYERLLRYVDKQFAPKDIIKESNFIFKNFSIRTAEEKLYQVL